MYSFSGYLTTFIIAAAGLQVFRSFNLENRLEDARKSLGVKTQRNTMFIYESETYTGC